jgi:glycosyltransferase involved in cell wall biosynthesis
MNGSTLWIDVGDLINHIVHHDRPSGIQRVAFEICQALHQMDQGAGRVRFLRRGTGPRDLVTVEWDRLANAFHLATNANPKPTATPRPPSAHVAVPLEGSVASAAVSTRTGPILSEALALQARVLLVLARLPLQVAARAVARLGHRLRLHMATRRQIKHQSRQPQEMADAQFAVLEGVPLEQVTAPGDSFVALGSPWMHRDYVQTVRWVRDEQRMRFALLIYDLVPLRRPEWCDRGVVDAFSTWHRSVLPLADQIFAISRATADDVVAWTRETGMPLHNPVQPIPMGTGLNHEQPPGADTPGQPSSQLPPPGSYVLFVSTIEARKNHALLFRVWRRLLTEMPPGQLPTLVFAGRIGWLVADLMQQLENAAWLGGKIRLVRNPTDAELMALYRGCQFTLFPSLFEGWGLPVSESLALGRPCIASNRTSLPEAGGDLARYFDPENLDDACRTIRAAIEDPVGLAAWSIQVSRDFRHVPWSDSAAIIRRTLASLDTDVAEGPTPP